MTPDRKQTIAGRRIEEFYWAGRLVVYVDNIRFDGTFEEAVAQAQPNPDRGWEHISQPLARAFDEIATELAETDAAAAENARRIADLEARETAPARPFPNAAE